MQRADVKRLYFITDISNVPSILDHGLLSNRRAAKLPHVDISLASVQDIRRTKRVPGGLVLHDYAPLYLCPRNPMLFKRAQEMLDDLCVLGLHTDVFDLDGVVISDHNAAADVAHFAPSPDGLAAVDRAVTFAKYWTHADPVETEIHRKRMCAEVLVPQGIHPSFIHDAFVGTDQAKANFDGLGTSLPVQIHRYMFFL